MSRRENFYEDIIHLPHHVSTRHPQMPLANRAAQFAPFAALTGFDAAIDETARTTLEEPGFHEDQLLALDEQMRMLWERISELPVVRVTWFVPDERKAGGSYRVTEGNVRKIDDFSRLIVMEDGTKIAFDRIMSLDLI